MSAEYIDVHAELVKAGIPADHIGHHESDLHVKATADALRVVRSSGYYFEPFISSIDGSTWIDIPFAYLPWWKDRERGAKKPTKIYECGCCSCFHRAAFDGDCRSDADRFASPEDFMERTGETSYEEVEQPQ